MLHQIDDDRHIVTMRYEVTIDYCRTHEKYVDSIGMRGICLDEIPEIQDIFQLISCNATGGVDLDRRERLYTRC